MQLKKDLFKVFNSNGINLLVGIITGFLVPAFLSLDDYAALRTFTLYLSYVGILHFGFVDGVYIKYGGKYEEDLNPGKLKGEHRFLLLFQFLITALAIIVGIILDDIIFIAFAIAILPMNMQSLFSFLYQALGRFNIYSQIIVLTPTLLLLFNLLLIFVLKISNFWPFIIVNILTYYIVFLVLEIYFFNKYKGVKAIIDFKDIWSNFKVGTFILIGNLSTILFYAMDRWFVKLFLTTKDFAFYSFAVSMMGIFNTLISAVTLTFYPYLARGQDEENLKLLKKYLLIIGVFASGGYFVFDIIVNLFLEKYVLSLDIIMILFAGFPATIILNAIYINLYKANKQEKKYAFTVFIMCCVSIIFSVIALLIHKSTLSIALSTTLAFYFWYFYCIKDFKALKPDIKELGFLTVFVMAYASSHIFFNGIVYFVMITLATYLFYKKELLLIVRKKGLKKEKSK